MGLAMRLCQVVSWEILSCIKSSVILKALGPHSLKQKKKSLIPRFDRSCSLLDIPPRHFCRAGVLCANAGEHGPWEPRIF
ncbi:unnamed protein product [Dibothriocephalus latus]|uniref:Uncharacterized protein n=1 Tax=Dibothriocephalus latus TaxID=60516 RepID=A0A3P7MFG3_DIBLA|nr:unnamed protein product [Dibothriocephalus latus]